MVCPGLETVTNATVTKILAYPTTCNSQFYAEIMAAIFIILSFILFQADKDEGRKSDMISAMGVSAIVTIFLSLIGTLVGIIQADIFIEIFIIGLIFVAIWMFKN